MALMQEHGLSKQTFRCVLKELSEGTTDPGQASYVKSWHRSIPTIDWIGKNYGPGNYVMQFSWRGKDQDNKPRQYIENVMVEISEKYRDEFKRHRVTKKVKELEEQRRIVNEAVMEQQLEAKLMNGPEGQEPRQNPMEMAKAYVKEVTSMAESLGLTKRDIGGGFQQVMQMVLPALPGVLQAFAAMQQAQNDRFDKMLMLLMTNQQNAQAQMLELMKSQAGSGSYANAMKEVREMVLGTVDLKEAISGEPKETIADKIFKVIEAVAPQVVQMASMSAAQRAVDPRVKLAQGYMNMAPEFQAMRNDPGVKKEVIEKLDEHFGWEQTDRILEIAGESRPATIERQAQQRYPYGDPRNQEVTGAGSNGNHEE
jgi:hypothetical protein